MIRKLKLLKIIIILKNYTIYKVQSMINKIVAQLKHLKLVLNMKNIMVKHLLN